MLVTKISPSGDIIAQTIIGLRSWIRLATLEVNLNDLPEGAFKRYQGKKGQYHQAKFDLVVIFDSVVYLRFMHGDTLIKQTQTEYNPTTVIPGGRREIRTGRGDTDRLGDQE